MFCDNGRTMTAPNEHPDEGAGQTPAPPRSAVASWAKPLGLSVGVLLALSLAVSCMVGVATNSGEEWPILGAFLRSYEIERAERDGRLTEVPASVITKIIRTDELEVGDCYTKLPSAEKLEVALLRCDEPSAEGEVQVLIRILDGPYPGPDALFEIARSQCRQPRSPTSNRLNSSGLMGTE